MSLKFMAVGWLQFLSARRAVGFTPPARITRLGGSRALPNTPPHTVLLHEAFGDHQVANIATEVEARTIGAAIHQPAIAAGRNSDVVPYYGIPAIPVSPFDGSARIVWDSVAATPPTTNLAPSMGEDPHSDPRNSPLGRQQKSDFLKSNGAVVDVCSGTPCVAQ